MTAAAGSAGHSDPKSPAGNSDRIGPADNSDRIGPADNSDRIGPADLEGRTIDIHTHLGLSLKAYARGEYPYCQSIEGLYYRQQAGGVACSVVFPFAPDLFFDLPTLIQEDRMVPAARPPASAPYELENRMVCEEVYRFFPQPGLQRAGDGRDISDENDRYPTPAHGARFLPFVCIDPGRLIKQQLSALQALTGEYPVYGIKINPVLCQSRVTGLLEEGAVLLDFARERDLPLLFHVTVDPDEEFSQVSDTFRIVERHPELRYCLAHCAGFSREHLERAHEADNVWVDTSALKIQVQAVHENRPFMAGPGDRFDWDYADHLKVMGELAHRFPGTLVWGSDSPAYTYIARRLQGAGVVREFRLMGTYEDEKAALDALPPDLRARVGSGNAIAFLFGKLNKTG